MMNLAKQAPVLMGCVVLLFLAIFPLPKYALIGFSIHVYAFMLIFASMGMFARFRSKGWYVVVSMTIVALIGIYLLLASPLCRGGVACVA